MRGTCIFNPARSQTLGSGSIITGYDPRGKKPDVIPVGNWIRIRPFLPYLMIPIIEINCAFWKPGSGKYIRIRQVYLDPASIPGSGKYTWIRALARGERGEKLWISLRDSAPRKFLDFRLFDEFYINIIETFFKFNFDFTDVKLNTDMINQEYEMLFRKE